MFKYIKYLSVVTLLFLTTVSVAKAEESTTKASELVPGLDFIISADNMYSVESANFKTEFGIEAEATNLGILVGLYPLVHWDSQDASEYKAEIILEDNTKELIESLLAPLRASMRKISSIREIPDLQSSYMEIINDFLSSVQVILGAQPFSTYSRRQWKKNLLAFINRFNQIFIISY